MGLSLNDRVEPGRDRRGGVEVRPVTVSRDEDELLHAEAERFRHQQAEVNNRHWIDIQEQLGRESFTLIDAPEPVLRFSMSDLVWIVVGAFVAGGLLAYAILTRCAGV